MKLRFPKDDANRFLIIAVAVTLLFIMLLCVGCKTQKNDKSSYKIKEDKTENVITATSSVKETEIESGSKSESGNNSSEQKSESSEETSESWKETNYYDKDGNLRKSIKEGTTKNKKTDSQSNKNDNKQQSDSTYTGTKVKDIADSSSVSSSQNNIDTSIDIDQNTQSDSRLIQGVEWFYVIGAIVIVIGIVVFIVKKKK